MGFRVFRQVASSYKRWQPQGQQDYLSQLVAHSEPLTDGWQPTDLLWELALREGYSLDTTITVLGNDLYWVADPGKEQAMLVSLADQLRGFTLDGGMLDGATLFLCRDSALDDSGIANLKLQAKSLGLRFRTI